jgi:ribosomal protein S18 acetylase RimI-like enzyme
MAENTSDLHIRLLEDEERPWADSLMRERWGAEIVVVHGQVYRPAELSGFVAECDGARAGLITLHIQDDACEVVTLDSLQAGRGVGRALLSAARTEAAGRGCRRLWLVTTNDNIHALGFYQQNGFRLVALRPGAVEESRKVKPSIPLIGDHGIPLRDELELEMPLL